VSPVTDLLHAALRRDFADGVRSYHTVKEPQQLTVWDVEAQFKARQQAALSAPRVPFHATKSRSAAMSQATVNLCGVLLDVTYTYIPAEGDGWNEPHIPAYPEIDSVEVAGVNVDGLVEDRMDEICELVMKAREDARDEYLADMAAD
jgi:hypothetical protein